VDSRPRLAIAKVLGRPRQENRRNIGTDDSAVTLPAFRTI
jgi:hypothetical protein